MIIRMDKVSRIYISGTRKVHALRDFSLEVEAGEFSVLAGPSGSGKTTVLNLVGCLDQPSAGRIEVAGEEVSLRSVTELASFRLAHIGFIFQSYNLIPVLSARENAEFTLMLQGVPKARRRERVRELFLRLGIGGLEDRRPGDLSGGQQQRVAIARAMAAKPALILADEPTANLDSKTSEGLLELMRELNEEQGVSFLFSSHDPLIISRGRRVIELKDGRLLSDSAGSPR